MAHVEPARSVVNRSRGRPPLAPLARAASASDREHADRLEGRRRGPGETWHDPSRNGDRPAAAEFEVDGVARGIVARVDRHGRVFGAGGADGSGATEALTVAIRKPSSRCLWFLSGWSLPSAAPHVNHLDHVPSRVRREAHQVDVGLSSVAQHANRKFRLRALRCDRTPLGMLVERCRAPTRLARGH